MTGVTENLAGVLLVLVPGLPLAAALLGYLAAARNRGSMLPAWLGGVGLLGSTGLAAWLLFAVRELEHGAYFAVRWLHMPSPLRAEGLEIPLAFQGGQTQLLFCLTAALIGFVVLVFAGRERRRDTRRGVFFATLALFAGAMLLFLTADTLLLIYMAWELMGLCSYLLIAHPATREAWRAARQAFWTTRATDFGLLFAIILMMTVLGWHTLTAVDMDQARKDIREGVIRIALTDGETQVDQTELDRLWKRTDDETRQKIEAQVTETFRIADVYVVSIVLLILLAVVGKAAQFPLSFWLPDAMVAPAPVSAMLHAATMVAAGPYLLYLVSGLFARSALAMLLATLTGGFTMLIGAVMALCAREPKRILAYSTVSHLGLVVMSVGALAGENGYFHLLSHAWFKAALFLGVGYLVAAWAAENDNDGQSATLAGMAGYARRHPFVLWGILVPAGISLAGVPFFAGALGKEQILYALLTRYNVAPVQGADTTIGAEFPVAAAAWQVAAMMTILALPLTAAYITRLIGILGFGGRDKQQLPGEGGLVTTPRRADGWGLPLGLTGLLALVGSIGMSVLYFGWFATPRGFADPDFPWRFAALDGSPHLLLVMAVSVLAVAAGAGLTWQWRIANPASGDRLFRDGGLRPLADFFANGMYLREVFTTLIGRTGEFLAILAGIADIGFVDWLALRCGALGRGLAVVLRWIDEHIVDGLRWCVCEIVWILKRLHARTLQTGQIQFYMLVVLVSAVLLCIVVLRPLGQIMAMVFGR